MNTHYIQMFSGKQISINSQQALFIQDVLDNKYDEDVNSHIKFKGESIHIKGIEGVYKSEGNHRVVGDFPELPEPKNRYTREENIERMKKAAIEAKRGEQEKYGIQPWSTPIEDWITN